MKNVFSLLLVVGLLVAGWKYRDRLTGLRGEPTTMKDAENDEEPVAESHPPGQPRGAAPVAPTPHPAREAQAAAAKAYPALNMPGSTFSKKFLALHAEAQRSDPALLARADWPLKLAERAAIALGGGPMPISTPPAPGKPSTPLRSALDLNPGSRPPR